MDRLNRFVARTVFVAGFICSALLAPSVFAQGDGSESATVKIEALEQREVELKTKIADLRARINAVDAEITKLVVEASAAANTLAQASSANEAVDRSQLDDEETLGQLATDLAEIVMVIRVTDMHLKLVALSEYRATLEADMTSAKAALPRGDTLGGARKKRDIDGVSAATKERVVQTMPVPQGGTTPVAENAVALVTVATFTAGTPAEGWYAWKRQSQAWKKAHPWEGPIGVWCTNARRLNIPCTEAAWKKVPAGTIFLLPAPDVRVYVPNGVKAPEAIALTPGENAQLFTLDPSRPTAVPEEKVVSETPVVTVTASSGEKREVVGMLWVATIAFGMLALGFFVSYLDKLRLLRERDEEIILLKRSFNETLGIVPKAHEAGCCKTDDASGSACGHAEPNKDGCCRTDDSVPGQKKT